MWDVLGEQTVACLAAGALRLAEMWESAWKEGHEQSVAENKLGAIDPEALQTLYNDQTFVQSQWLRDM